MSSSYLQYPFMNTLSHCFKLFRADVFVSIPSRIFILASQIIDFPIHSGTIYKRQQWFKVHTLSWGIPGDEGVEAEGGVLGGAGPQWGRQLLSPDELISSPRDQEIASYYLEVGKPILSSPKSSKSLERWKSI